MSLISICPEPTACRWRTSTLYWIWRLRKLIVASSGTARRLGGISVMKECTATSTYLPDCLATSTAASSAFLRAASCNTPKRWYLFNAFCFKQSRLLVVQEASSFLKDAMKPLA